MLTEGGSAPVAESLKPRAEELHVSARPWTMGEGIQGLGIGQKVTDAYVRQEVVLKVYVEKKRPQAQCDAPVPKQVTIPGIAEQVETDVEEIGKVELESNTSNIRPAIPGFSLGHLQVAAGTFGCLVRVNGDQQNLYILSNSHVLANEGVCQKNDPIVQTGVYDGGQAPADVIAQLSKWVPFQFTPNTYPNFVDAAIAKVNRHQDVTSVIRKISVPTGISTTVRRGMRVQKTGRTTDYTIGVITDIDYRLALDYNSPAGGKGRVGLRDQVLCTRYTSGGDSGSAVLNMKGAVVGLHFAGSPSTSIFNKIANVIQALDISIVTETL